MDNIYLIIDESGAKGYSDNIENTLGEFGIMVGYLIPESWIDKVKSELDSIKQKYKTDRKVHITDLLQSEQEQMRVEIFNYFKTRKIFFVYEAIYSQGYYSYHESLKELYTKNKQQIKPSMKWSSNKEKLLLHSDLFLGVFMKALSFCKDIQKMEEVKLHIKSDVIDDSIKKKFEKNVDKNLNIGIKSTKIVKGFDTKKKEVVQYKTSFEITEGLEIFEKFSNVEYEITCEDSSLTLAADVLVNSLYRALNNSEFKLKCLPLNTYEAVEDFPLNKLIYGLYPHNEKLYIVDKIYSHPNNKD